MFNGLTKHLLFTFLIVCAVEVAMPGKQLLEVGPSAEVKAINFLSREVPAWSKNNGCFSCHNNGDAARALYAASRKGFSVPQMSLDETNAWVSASNKWEQNKGDPGFNDRTLATVQFASSLLAAFDSGVVKDHRPLADAARKLMTHQGPDGAWHIKPDDALGSPTTWGTVLTTSMAMRVLQREGSEKSVEASRRAQRWLSGVKVNSVLNAATLIMSGTQDKAQRQHALSLLRSAQTTDGGWGPYAKSPAEVFDTAMALLALSEVGRDDIVEQSIKRGRSFLVSQQEADGSWVETTRPSGGESYAQRISTTGWATLALLKTK